jgi:hypothetical protein
MHGYQVVLALLGLHTVAGVVENADRTGVFGEPLRKAHHRVFHLRQAGILQELRAETQSFERSGNVSGIIDGVFQLPQLAVV